MFAFIFIFVFAFALAFSLDLAFACTLAFRIAFLLSCLRPRNHVVLRQGTFQLGQLGDHRLLLFFPPRLFGFDFRQQGCPLGFALLPCSQLLGRLGQLRGIQHAPDTERNLVCRGRTSQDSSQTVIVRQVDRIELMVVAPHTAERHTKKDHPDLADLSIDMVRFHLGFVWLDDLDIPNHQKSGGSQVLGPFLRRGGGK